MPYSAQAKNIMRQWRKVNLDSLVSGYIEAALWSSTPYDDNGEVIAEDFLGFTLSDSFKQAMRERVACTLLKRDTRALFRIATLRGIKKDGVNTHTRNNWEYDQNQFGHDLWLTENGHGVGFWCREELEIDIKGNTLGDELTEAVQYREASLYLDDQQRVCI
jgi:hypothetical protein